jgi:hypothetical protein
VKYTFFYKCEDEKLRGTGGHYRRQKRADGGSSHLKQKIKGLYFAGEVLELQADTGGYNLPAWLRPLPAEQ